MLEQILLQAQIGADEASFTIDDVCRGINEKLVRRHPHIFGDPAEFGAVDSEGKVLDIWDDVKKQERADGFEPKGLLDSVPRSFPALMQCQKISKRAAKAGFEWDSVDDVWDQFASERAEFRAEEPGSEARAMEFGDMLFALVNVGDAFAMERMAAAEGREIESYSTEDLNVLWNRAKELESSAPTSGRGPSVV